MVVSLPLRYIPIRADWNKLTGNPVITVGSSANAVADGYDYGPDTPGTQSGGWQEALNALQDSGGGTIYAERGVHQIGVPLAVVYQPNSNGMCPSIQIIGEGNVSQSGGVNTVYTPASDNNLGTILQYTGTAAAPILAIGFAVNSSVGANGASLILQNFQVSGNGNETGGIVTVNAAVGAMYINTDNIHGSFIFRIVGQGGKNYLRSMFLQSSFSETSNFDALHITGIDKYATYTVGSTSVTVYGRPEGEGYGIRTNLNSSAASGSNINGIHIDDCNPWSFYGCHPAGGAIGLFVDDPAAFTTNNLVYVFIGTYYESLSQYSFSATGDNALCTFAFGQVAIGSADVPYNATAPTMVFYDGRTGTNMAIQSAGALKAVTFNGIATEGGGTAPVSITPPSSGSAYTNGTGQNIIVTVGGGTVSAIAINGVSTGLTSGTFPLKPGDNITVTYSESPTMYRYSA